MRYSLPVSHISGCRATAITSASLMSARMRPHANVTTTRKLGDTSGLCRGTGTACRMIKDMQM